MKIIESRCTAFTYRNAEKASLDNISLTVNEGECVVLTGKSGSGKTTFSRLLNGLCPKFFEGRLDGTCTVYDLLAGKTEIEEYVPLVGSVFQNPKTQYFNTDTTAELAFPCENSGIPSEEIVRRVEECAKRFGIGHLMNRSIFHLSGGEKQKIAFAASTMLSPKLLVLDEPTSNLDAGAIEDLRKMILQMKAEGVTIVLAEHRLAWLAGAADRYILFENGRVTGQYTAEEFSRFSQEDLYALGLRAADLHPLGEINDHKAVIQSDGVPLLETDGLTIGYGKNPVIAPDSIRLFHGEIVGLMGHNGIGKTTLAKTLCGLQKPLAGKILWNGKPEKGKVLTEHAFLVMQDVNYQLFADSVREEALLGAKEAERCDAILEKLGLLDFADRHPMSLSGGQKQRTAIASAMLSGKELIVLDEPTSGLDHYHMEQVGMLLGELKQQGKCVLVITHDEELTAGWCDRIIRIGE